ncbi:MAG: riboflavin synthase [Anaerovoracaceae bacterium]
MFTGIIEEIGTVKSVEKGRTSSRLKIKGRRIFEDMHMGDSIAVNGVCLTVCSFGADWFEADVMHETLNRTALGGLTIGSEVNMERAMKADGRFGGHIVSGHIDGVGVIRSKKNDGIAVWVNIETNASVLKYIVEKGSIAIDGISLTVARVHETGFEVSLIPHTGENTTLLKKSAGDKVNLENDIIGKYVERLMNRQENEKKNERQGITAEFLMENGF